jgi:Phosducin
MGERTEWDDILVKHGVKEADTSIHHAPTPDEYDAAAVEARERAEREANEVDSDVSLDGLEELEDALDDSVLDEYRQKRMAEMQRLSARARFGSLVTISEPQWIPEVNKAPEDVDVVVLLHESGIPHCEVVEGRLRELAARFPATKFLKIRSQEAIHNWPSKNLPTIFHYRRGDVRGQWIGMSTIGRPDLTTDELEWRLAQSGALKTELEFDPSEERAERRQVRRL